ncbi:WAP four-disulfide core domain protein 2 [Scaptodrosophila lebanonensis]|uniref:WAP four-disulfide core domain protein 2 n=1 Tax=Drosophila lebanonensis TaxID=7225 RepID=A0A6J2UF34_DROLE|nr:WAP four-disulfide core domain protein 2 [Scaptodrosophila lebanonensis]
MANKGNHLMLALLVISACLATTLGAGDCPSSTKVQNCTPKCLHDSECSAIGGKCCPNLCNSRSCVQPNLLGNSGGNSSPFSSKNSGGATGIYCGNVKCNSFEKCGMDRSTKRPMCMRS